MQKSNKFSMEDLILPVSSEIITRHPLKITFHEAISIIFDIFKHNKNSITFTGSHWEECWKLFEYDMKEQNNIGWPQFIIIKKNGMTNGNDIYAKNKYIVVGNNRKSGSLIQTNNFLLMLLRIIYVEKYKENVVVNQLDKKFTTVSMLHTTLSKKEVFDLDPSDHIIYAFQLVKKFIQKYLVIYNDANEFENQMGEFILKMFDQ